MKSTAEPPNPSKRFCRISRQPRITVDRAFFEALCAPTERPVDGGTDLSQEGRPQLADRDHEARARDDRF